MTQRELWFLDDSGPRRIELATIRKIGRMDPGSISVQGTETSLEIPLSAFEFEALKSFLQSLRERILEARKSPPPPKPSQASARPQAPEASWFDPTPPRNPSVISPPTLETAPASPAEAPLSGMAETPPPEPTRVWEEPSPPVPTPTLPPAPSKEKERSRSHRGAWWLKLLSLLTLAATLGYLGTHATSDPWNLIGVGLAGLGLGALEWRLAD